MTKSRRELLNEAKASLEYRRKRKRALRGTGKRPDLALRNKETARSKGIVYGRIRETRELERGMVVPGHGPLVCGEKYLPLDPYLLGLWLGDGSAHAQEFTTADEELTRWDGFTVTLTKRARLYRVHGLRKILSSMGLIKNKHVPAEYLRGSEGQRLSLLQGLMDTDGCCNRDGQAEFSNTNRNLADAVFELACSLGLRPSFTEGRAKLYGKDCGAKYTVKWTSTMKVFRLKRKLERLPKETRPLKRYITAVERVESVPVRCIEVDSPSHLFLAGRSMIPTHNSYLLRWWLVRQLIRRHRKTGIKKLTCGLFSVDYPTLQQRQISKMEREFPPWLGVTKRTEKEGLCFFLNDDFGGGRISLCNLADPNSYKSAEFCDIAVEELSENKRDVFEDLVLFRLRFPGIERPCFLGGTNPTGIGVQWIKALWIDRKFPAELKHLEKEFAYVPALLGDNPHLDQSYEETLRGLPEKKRRALLYGDWTVPEGQYFTNFERSERKVHPSVVARIVKPWWNHWVSQDWGFKHHTPVHWHAVGMVSPEDAKLMGRTWDMPKRCVFTYREHIESLGESGRSELELGKTIRVKSAKEDISRWILSRDAFGEKSSMNTPAQLLSFGADTGRDFPHPVPANMGPGSRPPGWRFMYNLIQNDEWFISELCPEALAAIPSLEYDADDGGEDILKTDHLYDDVGDELRYGLVDMLGDAKVPHSVALAERIAAAPDELDRWLIREGERRRQMEREKPQNWWE